MCRLYVRHSERDQDKTHNVPAQSHQTFLERLRECSGMFLSVLGKVLKVVAPNTEQQKNNTEGIIALQGSSPPISLLDYLVVNGTTCKSLWPRS